MYAWLMVKGLPILARGRSTSIDLGTGWCADEVVSSSPVLEGGGRPLGPLDEVDQVGGLR